MPDTTPRPKETAKTFTQNLYKFLYSGFPVRSHSNSSRASQLARPMVKAGKMMWNETVNANWMRESRSASNSIDPTSRGFRSVLAAKGPEAGGPELFDLRLRLVARLAAVNPSSRRQWEADSRDSASSSAASWLQKIRTPARRSWARARTRAWLR